MSIKNQRHLPTNMMLLSDSCVAALSVLCPIFDFLGAIFHIVITAHDPLMLRSPRQ